MLCKGTFSLFRVRGYVKGVLLTIYGVGGAVKGRKVFVFLEGNHKSSTKFPQFVWSQMF